MPDPTTTSPHAAPRAPAARRRTEFVLCACLAMAIVSVRSFVFVFYEQASFDADQAILGLMAKHASELRAFPLFQYGLPYMLALETYVTAPFFWIAGASVASLKLPLVLANCAIGILLIRLLTTTLSLRPLVATLAAMPFLLPAPIASSTLVEALGGNTAPLVFALLLWVCRKRPLLFGLVFAVGFITREFTAYGLAALLAIEAIDGSLFRREHLRDKLIALVACTALWSAIHVLRPFASAHGPGSAHAVDADAHEAPNVLAFFCWDAGPDRWVANLKAVAIEQAPALFGTAPLPLAGGNVASAGSQGLAWTSAILLAALLAATARLLWLLGQRRASSRSPFAVASPAPRSTPRSSSPPPTTSDARFAWYLMLVGVQAAVVYAISRCEDVGLLQQRYILLTLFFPVGFAGLFLAREPSRAGRTTATAVLAAWALLAAWPHVELIQEYAWMPPVNARRVLADALVADGVQVGRADYWDSYAVTFLANERVILAPDRFPRIQEYEQVVDAHADRAVVVSREPCPGGVRRGVWTVCRP